MAFTVGDLIDGHYRVEKRYAGGMGLVYIVRDEVIGKRFAIKQLPAFQAENRVLAERFRREASAWLLLDHHPHIVQAHSYHPRPEGPILILEFVDGPSLDRLLKAERALSPLQVVRYARQFCLAMSYAHSKAIPDRGVGVLHRDIKPGNLLVTRTNQLKVTDFGLAKFEESDSKLTGEGQFVGTIAYSSPEQLRAAAKVTRASDVYSFGAVMYQMLAGHAPYRGSNAAELYRVITQTAPLPLAELCPDVDASLTAAVMRCLDKDPARRYGEFAELDRALAGLELTLRDPREPVCESCGYVSRKPFTHCPVCETAGRAAAEPRAAESPWRCQCGAWSSAGEPSCPKCGRNRLAAALLDDDAPLPVTGDLVQLPAQDAAAAPPAALKPSDTAWPERAPAAPAPGDSHIAVAEAKPTSAPRQPWNPQLGQPFLIDLNAQPKLFGWLLDRSNYTIGRASHMRIRLKDPDIAAYQLFLVRLAAGWVALNRQPGTRLEFGGWKRDQQRLRPGDVIHAGSSWMAFQGPEPPDAPFQPLPGAWLGGVEIDMATVKSGGSTPTYMPPESAASAVLRAPDGRELTTRWQPIKIGSSAIADFRVDGSGVLPLHALLYWDLAGLRMVGIGGRTFRLRDQSSVTSHLLADQDVVFIGDCEVAVRIQGDATAPGRLRAAQELTQPPRMAVTAVAGPHKGQSAVLRSAAPVQLGRQADCDLALVADPYVSRQHLQLVARHGAIEIKDLGSRHGFRVGQTAHSDTATARIGDVIRVGQTFLLVHYELGGE